MPQSVTTAGGPAPPAQLHGHQVLTGEVVVAAEGGFAGCVLVKGDTSLFAVSAPDHKGRRYDGLCRRLLPGEVVAVTGPDAAARRAAAVPAAPPSRYAVAGRTAWTGGDHCYPSSALADGEFAWLAAAQADSLLRPGALVVRLDGDLVEVGGTGGAGSRFISCDLHRYVVRPLADGETVTFQQPAA